MKNGTLFCLRVLILIFISFFSNSIFSMDESVKSAMDKKIAVLTQSISDIEKELKEADLTNNELKFFRGKLMEIMQSIINDEEWSSREIDKKNELVERYGLYIFKKDKPVSHTNSCLEELKEARKEISLYKGHLSSVEKLKSKVNLLLDDIVYRGIRNRTSELFLIEMPLYEAGTWVDGYSELVELFVDGKTRISETFNAFNVKIITRLLFFLGIALLIICAYVKICTKFFKFLLSKLNHSNKKEITQYKDLLSEKSFFIFSRFVAYYLVPGTVIDLVIDYYISKNPFIVNSFEGALIIVVIVTLKGVLCIQAAVSTYFIKSLNFPHLLFAESRAFKFGLYSVFYLLAGLSFINVVDVFNEAINFNRMVYPDCAAILNLLITTLLSINLFRIIPHITRYIKVASKRAVIVTKIIMACVLVWAVLSPIMVFIGLSNLIIEVAVKIMLTGLNFFFFFYMYHFMKEVVPLLIGTIASFVGTTAHREENSHSGSEHELHKKYSSGNELLKYWTNLLVFAGMTVWTLWELLIIWGFPPSTLSYVANIILFEKIHIAGQPIFSISLLFTSLVSGFIVFYVFKVAQHIVETKVFPYTKFDEGTRHAIKTTIGYIGLLFAVIIFVYTLGLDMTTLTFIISGFSIGIGFSLQELFKNFFSGLVLLIERPIKVGDILNIDGSSAKVKQIRIRCTILESSGKDTILIPNSEFVNKTIINETMFPLSRIEIGVDVAYGEDPVKIAELLKNIADSHEKVSKTFKSTVEFIKFNENSISLILKVFVKRTERGEVANSLKLKIFNMVKDSKVAIREIPFKISGREK